MEELVLVLNLGLKSIRSIIFDPRGRKLVQASSPVQTSLKGIRVEQDPREWWEKGVAAMRETLGYRRLGETVKWVTVTSSSSCLVVTDGQYEAIAPAIMVSDRRAEAEAEWLRQHPRFDEVKRRTRLGADSSLMIPKILWLKEHEPDIFGRARRFLSPNDYFVAGLTGRAMTDFYNAQKFHYDQELRQYPVELFDSLEVAVEFLPEVGAPGTVVGEVTRELAGRLGFRGQPKLVLSSYDAICAFFGSGPTEAGEACDVSGTVSSLRVLSRDVQVERCDRIHATPAVEKGVQIVGGSNNLGGGLIEWAKQCFYSREEYPYEVMEKEARESSIGARGLIFLPYLMGERAPVWNPDARGVFFGLERYHGRGDLIEAVFESAGFTVRHLMEAIEAAGVAVGRIRVSGGLTRIAHISQLKADITGREVLVVDEFETTSLGAMLFASVGIGRFPNMAEAAKVVRVRMVIHPDPERHKVFSDIFGLYCELYETLIPLFSRRMNMLASLHERVESKVTNL